MTFTRIPLGITGPSYLSRSRPLSSQQTVNWYQQYSEQAKVPYVLLPFYGLKNTGDATGSNDRGLHRMDEKLYSVKGAKLYSVDRQGRHTELGDVPGAGRAIMADDGINLFIVSDLKVWRYSTDTNLISAVTDPNIDGSKSVDFINNQFIYTKDRFTSISNAGNGTEVNPLNVIGEETLPDDLVRDYVFEEIIYRCGVRSIVGWWNNGVGNPPIEKYQGRIFYVGLAAIHSINNTDRAMYWLGDDNAIYRASGGAEERISTDAISHEISQYAKIDDAIGNVFNIEGQDFYAITFPTGNKTFVINESLGVNGWFELSSGLYGDSYQATSIISCYNKMYAADEQNGQIYTLDVDTYTNNNEPIKWTRVTQFVDGTAIGGTRRDRVGMSTMSIEMETGVGLISGQGENPRIMVEFSDDGGMTWSEGTWARVGRLGEFVLLVEFDNLSTFYSRAFRISSTDPVSYSIFDGTIDLRLAGK